MGRELRMVPQNWEHPKHENGSHKSLLSGSFSKRLSEWEEGKSKWSEGLRENWAHETNPNEPKWIEIGGDYSGDSWEEWAGERPVQDDYMPDWPEEKKTHFQMYENTSEGTPISPPMATPELLAQWLADNGAFAFAGMTATYSQWLNTINSGYCLSAVMINGELISGVEASED